MRFMMILIGQKTYQKYKIKVLTHKTTYDNIIMEVAKNNFKKNIKSIIY
jgi:hypothetical protein